MTDQVYVITLVVAGLGFLAVIALAIIALYFGRPLRAAGRVRLSTHDEFSFEVEAPSNSPGGIATGQSHVIKPNSPPIALPLSPRRTATERDAG